jgi:hypothetical protein
MESKRTPATSLLHPLFITDYENSPAFAAPTSWCPPGITAEQIKNSMRPPLLALGKAERRGPLDREVRVLDFGAMERGCGMRMAAMKEEVREDLAAMGLNELGLPLEPRVPFQVVDEGVGDSAKRLSDLPQGLLSSSASASSSSSSSSANDITEAELLSENTPPTPWLDEGSGVPRVGQPDAHMEAGARENRRERQEEDAVTAAPQRGRRSRPYDQDEMVRKEQAFLPTKRTRKPRQLFGEDADTQPQSAPIQQSGRGRGRGSLPGPSNSTTSTHHSMLGKRKRDSVAEHPAPCSSAASSQSLGNSNQPLTPGSMQEALEQAGLTDQAIADRTKRAPVDDEDPHSCQFSEAISCRLC